MARRKPAEWIGSSLDDLRAFPREVRRLMGQAIDDAQLGSEHPAAKALKGIMVMKKEIPVRHGSGNVFADLGFENPEEEALKADLVREIRAIIRRRKLTQAQAAQLLGIRQPDVSSLVNGRVEKFSLQRMLMFMPRLGHDVKIIVKPKPSKRPARLTLAVAG